MTQKAPSKPIEGQPCKIKLTLLDEISLLRAENERLQSELRLTRDERARAQHACELMGARITRLENLIRTVLEEDLNADAADAVTVRDVWIKEAEEAIKYDWGAAK